MGLTGSEHGKTWQEALADLFVELQGLVKDGRELVQAQLAAERAEAEHRAQRARSFRDRVD